MPSAVTTDITVNPGYTVIGLGADHTEGIELPLGGLSRNRDHRHGTAAVDRDGECVGRGVG